MDLIDALIGASIGWCAAWGVVFLCIPNDSCSGNCNQGRYCKCKREVKR